MEKSIFVIDIDDTISKWNNNRDYLNFEPIYQVIDKINELYEFGHTIILFTARGMLYYNGDLELIEKNNRKPLERWLSKNNVKYHSLIFGKPYADYYVDDKNLSIGKFLNHEY